MKKIIYPILLISGMWLLASCESKDFLDETETTDLDAMTVFSDSTYTTAFLTDIYTGIGFASEFDRFNDGPFSYTPSGGPQTACDEAEPRQLAKITTDIQFITGTVNPVIISDDSWNKPYENIRKVNQFLKHLPDTPLTEGKKRTYAAEARFLRAWYYSVLLRHYGGVPLIGDTIYTYGDDINSVRNTYAECVDYIVSECDAAAKDLPVQPSGRERGRVGAGACKSLKARVLLFGASPLFNGSDYAPETHKTLLGYPEYSLDRWRLALEAAEEVIGLGVYSLYVDNDEEPGRGFYRIFLASDWTTQGTFSGNILEKKAPHGQGRERLFQPPSRNGGGGGWIYQELVDAFDMKNGKPITDPESGYDPANPYANRDPRFYNTVTYDQSVLRNGDIENVPVNIFLGNYNGTPSGQDAVHTGTPTGYYIKKMLHRACAANFWIGVPQSRPLLRYAEVLLNYAEAKNEYEGPTAEVYSALEAIRERAGMDPFTLPSGLSQDEMREVIRHERRIELAFEGFRFWDVRRWMIAEQTETQMMTGMEVIRDGDNVEYNRFNVRKHVFRKATYFWPIPYKEVAKSPELVQNPYY
ncbi:RagB/SusD family nutrient uptake outer membrane protein [Sunxiuqinia sp. A32]|uniref:RagB/SusD family nutrient uptake outer membrane protein n=1 Tax=Sunxiuqinia sp. A32 TaxID=3461496 RepID=UPI0040458109